MGLGGVTKIEFETHSDTLKHAGEFMNELNWSSEFTRNKQK